MATEARDATDLVADAPADGSGLNGHASFPPEHGVYGQLFREGYAFNFFQAVRLLERYFGDAPAPGQTWDAGQERICFRPDPALVFPATDVKAVEAVTEPVPQARLALTFMGLYGVDAPLPLYYYEDLARGGSETEVLRAFLDLFNQRLYAYFYRAWKKYRPDVGHRVGQADRHRTRFLAVAGLGTRGAVDRAPLPDPLRLAAFAAWLSPHARHAEGLQKLLAAMLDGVPVRIVENVARRVPLRSRPAMGRGGLALGASAVVGKSVKDVSGKFRVVLGPLPFDAYLTFLPGRANARLLAYLVRLYAPDYLDYDVELQLDTANVPRARLGDRDLQLGVTMRLGKPSAAVVSHVVTYADGAAPS